MGDQVCELKHKHIDERLQEHDKVLKEHGTAIQKLDRSNATNTEAIRNLCKQIKGLVNAVWGLVVTLLSTGISFFIWYTQNVGRPSP